MQKKWVEAKEEMDLVFGPEYGWEPCGQAAGVHTSRDSSDMEDGTRVDMVDGRNRWNHEGDDYGDEPESHQIHTPGARRSPRGSLSPAPTSPAAPPGPASASRSPPPSDEDFSAPMDE